MCHLVQDGGQRLKRPSIRDQYPRDIVKPAGMKNDINSMRSLCTDVILQVSYSAYHATTEVVLHAILQNNSASDSAASYSVITSVM